MAEGIFLELQRDALDDNISLEMLLQKVYLVAKKLKLDELEKWACQELDGYDDVNSIPDYRQITGETKAWNPLSGWIPILAKNPKSTDALSHMPLTIPISSIIECYKSNDVSIEFSLSSQLTDLLNKGTGYPTQYSFFVSKSELYRIISTVRKKILEWSITLEGNELLKEGKNFSEIEKTIATPVPTINYYENNFYDSATDVNFVQGKC
ncbi:hypothetical protein SAMN02910298_00259 [Pseudobutyrivibrio sp. YE44]|uniref:AbiTii domain-containing protein n=1 Tax=Pseudobutyrivibrio sp. YE44 TaxID=1520802 RepID=UPI000885B910|nr:hypothetical protein [Pseudobutyrivibrio sp. YE44]SDB07647.1 hypothetical protein SAMN02910298_00259 [Pseudobutyrivibrio sp. YE44]